MKAQVLTKVTISASSAEVFKYLKDLDYHYLWNPALRNLEPVIKLAKGSVYNSTSLVLGIEIKATNTVTKYTENKELELENTTGMVHYIVNYRLNSSKHKTILSCSIVVDSDKKAFAFTKPILELLARRELQADLQALKIAVEQKL